MLFKLAPVGVVLAVLATMVIIKTTSGSTPPLAASKLSTAGAAAAADHGTTALPAGVLSKVTSVSPSTFTSVGTPTGISEPVKTTGNQAVLLASDGKPEVLYVGAEYCPFCAAQRWAVVVALSRFGTFSNLSATHSSTSDIYPDTKTFSFYGSTYTSPYLDFVPVEEQSNQVVGNTYGALQTPTTAETKLLSEFDTAQYTSEPGSIPFLDIGNQYLTIGASYTPQVLAGLSMQQIAQQLNNPSSVVADAIDGTANAITAAITKITGDQPSSVANSTAIVAAAKKLGA
jgi:hypothetical protein